MSLPTTHRTSIRSGIFARGARFARDLGDLLGRLIVPVAAPVLRPQPVRIDQPATRTRRPFVSHCEW